MSGVGGIDCMVLFCLAVLVFPGVAGVVVLAGWCYFMWFSSLL